MSSTHLQLFPTSWQNTPQTLAAVSKISSEGIFATLNRQEGGEATVKAQTRDPPGMYQSRYLNAAERILQSLG